jgi:hypothetical protein
MPAHGGHRISAHTGPTLVRPIARAAPWDKSMSRPRVNGPRSLITTTVEAPVRGFVSFTRVPNGNVLWAAVRPPDRNGWPLAVPEPELYWVAFIEPLGQLRCIGAAKAISANQVDTSSRGIASMSLIDMPLSPVLNLQKEKPQRGAGGLEAGASDLRDQYSSRDRSRNDRPLNLVPTISSDSRLHRWCRDSRERIRVHSSQA